MIQNRKRKLHNILIMVAYLSIATLLSYLFFTAAPQNLANVSLFYILALILIARSTDGYWYGLITSIISVICINFLYTYPYFKVNFTLAGYPVTFVGMLTISIFTSTMTTMLKQQSQIIAEREKIIMENEKEKMRATLLRAISHDIRTPLTSIISATSSYLDHSEDFKKEDIEKLISHVQDDSNWLLHMVENLLSVTRIQDEKKTVTKTQEIVEEVVSEAVLRVKKRLPNAKILVEIPEDYLLVPMDAMLIEQVIINLLENAITHSQSKQPVELLVTEETDSVTFHVVDYGIGIDEAILPHIFDAHTISKTSDSHKGMGIGLSICKTIIVAHNGTILAINHENGAEFQFTLPKEDMTNVS